MESIAPPIFPFKTQEVLVLRAYQFFLVILTLITGNLFLEVKAVRRDQNEMLAAYDKFLALKAGGKPLGDQIKRGSVAVFKSKAGMVGCAVFK